MVQCKEERTWAWNLYTVPFFFGTGSLAHIQILDPLAIRDFSDDQSQPLEHFLWFLA